MGSGKLSKTAGDNMSDEDFTAGERAFFESRGANTEGLEGGAGDGQGGGAGDGAQPGQAPALGGQDGEAGAGQGADQQRERQDQQAGQQQDQDGAPKHVPVNVFVEERTKRKAVEKQLADLTAKQVRAEERLATINELLAPQQKQQKDQQEEWIDPETDIFGAFKQLMGRYQGLEKQLNEGTQRFEAQTEAQRIEGAYRGDAQRFMAQEPAFADAYRHLVGVRAQELELLGVTDQAERQRIIAQEEMQIAAAAMKGNRSPAATIFELAKTRGFVPQQKQAQNGEAQNKLDDLEKARGATPSLSGVGSSGSSALTLAQIADMPDEEFEAYVGKLKPSERSKLLGG